jgi:cyclomaltodextrinase / maltogenic alpha-amylase / neopullulanase
MDNPPKKDSEPLEFLFGPLSTESGRVKRSRSMNVGLQPIDSLTPLDPQPGADVTITIQAGLGISLSNATLLVTLDGTLPDRSSRSTLKIEFAKTHSTWDDLIWSTVETWSATIPGQAEGTTVKYEIVAQTLTGEEISCPHINSVDESLCPSRELDLQFLHRLQRFSPPKIFEYHVDTLGIPSWVKDAVIYQIFVDRFSADPGKELVDQSDLTLRAGGTLKGISERLDYLRDLGINCLWLTPTFPAHSYHGYDPLDFSSIAPDLGTLEDFKELVRKAHLRRIKVLLDFVANHVSSFHPAFQAAQKSVTDSHQKWFFFKKYPNQYESFFDIPGQPILNTDNPEVRDYLIRAAEFWLSQGCDGFRLDHAQGASHAFWSEFRTRTREVNPKSVMLGEITEPSDAIKSYSGRMDGALDFTLAELLRKFFAFRSIRSGEFIENLEKHLDYFQDFLVLPSFLDNHDMNRFSWIVQGDTRRLKLAALCQFSLPQPPIIYYGTEVGLSQRQAVGALEESRLPMKWDSTQDKDLLEFFRHLIRIRQSNSTAWRVKREYYFSEDHPFNLVYRVGSLLIALNNSPYATQVVHQVKKVLISSVPGVETTRSGIFLPAWCGAICDC